MSAITSLGYPDWQRLTVWDGPILWSLPQTAGTVPLTSPVMEASRYASVGGSALVTNGVARLRINWYADQALTVLVGQRDIRLASGYGGVNQFHLPNLGPYCQAQFTSLLGATYTAQAQLFMTNRIHRTEVSPTDAVIYDAFGVNLASNGTLDTKPLAAYAGPLMVYMSNPAALWVFNFHALAPSGNFDTFATFQPTSAVRVVAPIHVPLHSWSVQVTNLSAAAGTFDVCAVAATTGAT